MTLTAGERWDAEIASGQKLQEMINATEDLNVAEQLIKAIAIANSADLPQYAGFWDQWFLAKATQDIGTKGSLIFKKDDIILRKPMFTCISSSFHLTAYSVRAFRNVSVWNAHVSARIN